MHRHKGRGIVLSHEEREAGRDRMERERSGRRDREERENES